MAFAAGSCPSPPRGLSWYVPASRGGEGPQMTNALKGKVAVVTGGSRGIGYCIAERLLKESAKVYICARELQVLKQSLEKLRAQGGGEIEGMAADVGRYADCRKLIHNAAEHFGGIDLLVNNAGIGIMKPVDQLTARGVGHHDSHQLVGRVLLLPRGHPPDAQARRRLHLQHIEPRRR